MSGLYKEIGALKTKRSTRTTGYALPAGQTLTVLNRLPEPGKAAHIDTDWAIEGTNSALQTTC
jgi:hypothetical protein